MATTYYSDRTKAVLAGNTNTYPPARGDGRGFVNQAFSFTVDTALVVNDVVQLVKVPAGAIILDLIVASGGTQSGSDSNALIGDGADTDRYVASASGTILRSGGGFVRLTALTGINYQYTDEDTIDLLVGTVGTGQTTGGYIKGWVNYRIGGN